jgi:hypothetical protein
MTGYLTGYTLPKFFRYPSGILAKGPASLMRSYSSVLEEFGVRTNLTSLCRPRHESARGSVVTDPDLELLIFCPEALCGRRRGEPPPSFVLARRIVCQLIEPS